MLPFSGLPHKFTRTWPELDKTKNKVRLFHVRPSWRQSTTARRSQVDALSHTQQNAVGRNASNGRRPFFAGVGHFPVFTQGVCVLWKGKRALLPSLFLAFEERGFGLIRLFVVFCFTIVLRNPSPRRSILRTPPAATAVLHRGFG